MSFIDDIKKFIVNEAESAVNSIASSVAAKLRRNLLFAVMRATILVISLIFISIGAVLLGAQFVGLDIMFLTMGVLFLIAFLLIK